MRCTDPSISTGEKHTLRQLTSPLPHERTLDHGRPCAGFPKGHLVHDRVFLDHRPAFDAKPVPGCCVVFDDVPAAVAACRLQHR